VKDLYLRNILQGKFTFHKVNSFTAEEVSGKMNGNEVLRDYRSFQYWLYIEGDMGYWIYQIMIPLVATFGFIGNLISILVLRRPEMKSTFNQSLVMLAVVDILFVISVICVHSLRLYLSYYQLYKYLFPYFLYPMMSVFYSWDTFLTMSIATERLMAVYKPIQYRSHPVRTSSLRHMLTFILVPLLLSIAINITRFFELKHYTYTYEIQGKVHVDYYYTKLRRDPLYISYYLHWTRLILTGIIPFIFLITTNTIIFVCIRRNSLKNHSARMLTAIVVIFLICNLPRLVGNFVEFIYAKDETFINGQGYQFKLLYDVVPLFLTINSSVNFLIYITMGRRFKQVVLKKMIGCYRKTCTSVGGIETKQTEEAPHDIELVTRTTSTLEESSSL